MKKALLILSASAVVAAAHAVVIDDFGGPNTFVQTNSVTTIDYDSSVYGGVPGGTRYLGQSYQFGNLLSAAAITGGELDVSTPSNAVTNTALCYGNITGDAGSGYFPTPVWYVDTSAANHSVGGNAIRFNFISNEQLLHVSVYLVSDAGFTQYDKDIAGGQYAPFVVDLTSADITSAGAANLGSFDSMEINFSTSPSGDFALKSIESVPEPASMVALGIGALGLLRKRRSK